MITSKETSLHGGIKISSGHLCGRAAAGQQGSRAAETVWRNQCKIQKIFYLLVITKSRPASAAYLEVSRAAAAKQMSHSGEIPITFGSSQKLAINFDHSFPIVRAGSRASPSDQVSVMARRW